MYFSITYIAVIFLYINVPCSIYQGIDGGLEDENSSRKSDLKGVKGNAP